MSLMKNSSVLVLDKDLACILGLNEALVLEQINYWLEMNKKNNRNFHEGRYWTYNTIKDWQKEFPFWSESTIKRIFKRLRDMEIIIVDNFNVYQMDRTLWYSIDYEKLEEITSVSISSDEDTDSSQFEPMDTTNKTSAIPEISSEITSDMYNQSINQLMQSKDYERQMDGFNTKYEEIIYNCELYAIDSEYKKAVAYAIKLLLLDTYKFDRVQIGRNSIPSEMVYRDLEGLNFFVIDHAIHNFKEASRNFRIKNPIAYIKSCIYNAIYEVDIATDSSLRYNNAI